MEGWGSASLFSIDAGSAPKMMINCSIGNYVSKLVIQLEKTQEIHC